MSITRDVPPDDVRCDDADGPRPCCRDDAFPVSLWTVRALGRTVHDGAGSSSHGAPGR
jgi:hypothetical protein